MWAEAVEFKQSIARPVPDWEDIVDDETDTTYGTVAALDTGRQLAYPGSLGLPYLRERGIIYPTHYRLGIRFDPYDQRVLFPVYDHYGQFRGFTGRSIQSRDTWPSSYPKVKDYLGLNKREVFLGVPPYSYLLTDTPNIIVEGLFDYALLVQAGYPRTRAILGTSLTEEKIEILIAAGEPVYFFMDNDDAGWAALFGTVNPDGDLETENAWAYRLYKEIPVWIVPYPQPFNGKDPGSIPANKIKNYLKRAWLFTGKPPMSEIGTRHLLPPF
jgi:hypothetical protein